MASATGAKGKYPAKVHFRNVLGYIKNTPAAASLDGGVIYLESSKSKLWPNSDQEQPLRQDRFFYYLTGCELPDCYVVYDIDSGKSCLFLPPLDPSDVVWSGLPISPAEALQKYDVDDVRTSNEVNSYLNGSEIGKSAILAIDKLVSDQTTFLSFESKDFLTLKEAIEEARVVKDSYEIDLIKRANNISGKAHAAVVKAAKTASNEAELKATFVGTCLANGAKHQAYDPILASGTNAATLHYVHNDQPLKDRLNVLVDAACEYDTYAADITRTFPLNGKFTKESADIYSLVLSIQETVIGKLKADVSWDSCQHLAHELVVDGLLKLGILKGSKDEILKAQTSTAFLPHGLGHYLGMDTHDTGGHPNYNDAQPMFKYLRVRGNLPAGSVITVEPGVYFCRFIIEPYLKDAKHKDFIDKDVLEKYWTVGGVRIEDDVLITKDGHENLTNVPKSIEEIEAIMAAA